MPGMSLSIRRGRLIDKHPCSHEGLILDYETALTYEMDVPTFAASSDSSTGMRIYPLLLLRRL